MKLLITLLATILTLSTLQAQEAFQHTRLTILWEIYDDLKTTESVLYDPAGQVLYVANINENPWQKDNNGYISKVALDGKMISARWATGLSAPKGMGISNGKLYVTNIDEVAEIDLATGSILKRLTNPRAVNLNDIAVSREGVVYVSDSKGDCLYQVTGGKLEVLSDSPEVKASNGLFVKNGLLLCGQQNRIAALNLKTKEVTTYIDNTGGIDGIEAVGNKTYLISDWSGHIYMVEPDKERMLLLDTTPLKINAADIGYNKSEGILYVPTFFNNGVVAYKLD
jgi:DNA-binding beta-propeller fold protein YncE